MASTDVTAPAAVPPAPRPLRRRWVWCVLAGCLLLAVGLLAREGWAYWEEQSARRALAEEHFDEAQRHMDRALWVRPGGVASNLLAARIARMRRAYGEAEQYLSRCGTREGMSEEVQLEWLLVFWQRGEGIEYAPALLACVDRHHPESAAILEALADVYMRQTRYFEALDCLDRWLELSPDCVRALDWRGWVHNQLDHRGQAFSDYERALELQPGRSAVRLRLAEIFIDSARYPEAVPLLERLRQEQPNNPDVLVNLARCWVVQSRTDEARDLLELVLTAHPDHFEAANQLGQLEKQYGNYAKAEHWLRKALERSPRNENTRYALYLCLNAQANREKEAQEELARWKQDKKDQDRLTQLMRTGLLLKPKDPDLAAETGRLLLEGGENQRGLYWLHRALALDPGHAPSHRALIAYYERTHDTARAAEHRRLLAASGPGK
jgi:tetratricopeptide (TPR) repeat protein